MPEARAAEAGAEKKPAEAGPEKKPEEAGPLPERKKRKTKPAEAVSSPVDYTIPDADGFFVPIDAFPGPNSYVSERVRARRRKVITPDDFRILDSSDDEFELIGRHFKYMEQMEPGYCSDEDCPHY